MNIATVMALFVLFLTIINMRKMSDRYKKRVIREAAKKYRRLPGEEEKGMWLCDACGLRLVMEGLYSWDVNQIPFKKGVCMQCGEEENLMLYPDVTPEAWNGSL